MNSGYVYILSNECMPGLLKIGLTSRSPEERARELSSPTGVPTEYTVEYEVFSPDTKSLESSMHDRLRSNRVNGKREFFKVELNSTIEMLSTLAYEQILKHESYSNGVSERFQRYEAVEILGRLKKYYPNMIREELVSARIYQTRLRCYLEITEEDRIYEGREVPLVDQKIHRMDLGFIMGDDGFDSLLFNPKQNVLANSRVFLDDFDSYSKLVCCSELFNDHGCTVIQNEHFYKNA